MKLLVQYKDDIHTICTYEDQKSIFHMMEHRFSDTDWMNSVSLLILIGDQGSIKIFKPNTTYRSSVGEPDIHTQIV